MLAFIDAPILICLFVHFGLMGAVAAIIAVLVLKAVRKTR